MEEQLQLRKTPETLRKIAVRLSGEAFGDAGCSLLLLECTEHTRVPVSSFTLGFHWEKGKASLSLLIPPVAGFLSFPLDSSQKCCTALEFISAAEQHVELAGHGKLPPIHLAINPGVMLLMKH